jgi:hypothetical protein
MGFMKYAFEMGSGDMIYIKSFVNIDTGIQMLVRCGDSLTHRQYGDRISLFSFFKNKESSPRKLNLSP